MVFKNYLPQDICIQGNWQLLYSIFRNLTDNAINYAGANTTIELSAEQEGSGWHFTFSDNGAGIPENHLPRIFERFYRIDKSRSRAIGGTGLGLSIVKNAVLLHGGSITAQNNPQGGLCFNFTINDKQ
jgi:signal transduction histidine kinase